MVIQRWHDWVNQPKETREWHEADIADELAELQEATKLIHKWSELSDVVYTVTRARWSGHEFEYPITRSQIVVGHIYMIPKYSSRVLFFRRAGKRTGAEVTLQSVRNPKKLHKLQAIAEQNQLDPDEFVTVCHQQLKYWPLLP